MKFVYFALLSFLIFNSLYLRAEEESSKKSDSGFSGPLAYVIYTSKPKKFDSNVSVIQNGQLVDIKLSKRIWRNIVKIPADGNIQIVRRLEGEIPPEHPGYTVLATASVPTGVTEALVVLQPVPEDDNSGLIFRSKVFSMNKFRTGGCYFFNVSPRVVGVKIGEERVVVKPGKVGVYKTTHLANTVGEDVSYNVYDVEDGEWYNIAESTLALRPMNRQICLFMKKPGRKRVTFYGFNLNLAGEPVQ